MLSFRKSLWIATICGICALVAASGCKKAKVDYFPASHSVSGWEKTDETRTFPAKDLWQYIDGDAEQYISAGVVSTSTTDYKYQGKLEAVLDIHTMASPDGAHKILANGKANDAKSVQIGDEGIAYAQSVIFRKGTHLVRIVAYDSTPDTAQALLALAHGVEAKL